MPTLKDAGIGPQLTRMLKRLKEQTTVSELNHRYLDGQGPEPKAVIDAKLTKAYRTLMPMSEAPWGSLVVDSVQDRLEVASIDAGSKDVSASAWEIWQNNGLDAEAKLAQHSSLVDGRVFATVWPDADGNPEIVYDRSDQVVVEYDEGRHKPRQRRAGLRAWKDEEDGRRRVTLYRRDFIYKLIEAKEGSNADHIEADGAKWEVREELDDHGLPEQWPLPNPWNVVIVVEVSTNRRIQPGRWSYARGEFQHAVGIIDRIHLLTFLGLVVAVWMGFPIRGVKGERIVDRVLRDDTGAPIVGQDGEPRKEPVPPFEARPDSIVQFENPAAEIFEFKAADRKLLSVYQELGQLAYVTKTPAHYFPTDTGLSNISADMIRALEGGLHAKTDGIHKPLLGEGHLETIRIAGLMLPDNRLVIPPKARIIWADKQSRSLAESADAITKLASIKFPAVFLAEKFLGLSQDDIASLQGAMGAESLMAKLIEDAKGDGAQGGGDGNADS